MTRAIFILLLAIVCACGQKLGLRDIDYLIILNRESDVLIYYPPLPLDQVANAWAGYSVARRLSTNWTGPLFGVRRASDSAITNIGYMANNDMDYVALGAFCGLSDGLVITNHDQTGNGHHRFQLTAANQAKVFSGTVKILPLGDSITWGYQEQTSIGGYRGPLYSLLTNKGWTVDFMGPGSAGPATLPDKDHAGYDGAKIFGIDSNIDPLIESYSPNLVLLMAGMNDVLQADDMANAPTRLQTLWNKFIAQVPGVRIFVGSVTPVDGVNHGLTPTIVTFNNAVSNLVLSLGSAQVTFIDIHSSITTNDISDDIHPVASAYTNIANKWAATITNATVSGSVVRGSNGAVVAFYDGVNDTDATAQDVALVQPWTALIQMEHDSWTTLERVYDGYVALSGTVFQNDASPKLSMYAGFLGVVGPSLPLDTPGLITCIWSGAGSSIQLNVTTATTGNPGTASPQGVRVGCDANGVLYSNIKVSEFLVYGSTLSGGNITILQTNLNYKFGDW